jgi:hypothetical protein
MDRAAAAERAALRLQRRGGTLVLLVLTSLLPLAELRRYIREQGEDLARLLGADTEGA